MLLTLITFAKASCKVKCTLLEFSSYRSVEISNFGLPIHFFMIVLEACVENVSEALKAAAMGAQRIELCENLAVGGTTPTVGTLKVCRRYLTIPIFVMIRPRGGNFTYTDDEKEVMREDLIRLKEAGADGLVLGMLTPEKRVDLETLYSFLELARPLPVTFHKAIDETHDILFELNRLKEAGVDRVLSSGGATSALEGASMLNAMIHLAGRRMKIVAAGKISNENIALHIEKIPTSEFHGRKIVGTLEKLTFNSFPIYKLFNKFETRII